MDKYIVGIDVGGSSCKCGIFDENNNLIHTFLVKTDKTSNGKNILPDIINSLNKNLEDLNIKKNEILALGFTVPGPVVDNVYVKKAVNVYWTEGFNIRDKILPLLDDEYDKKDITIKVGNDANLAALGECYFGVAKNYKDAVMITLGTGVGGGVILNGNVLNGKNGVGGEIGHIFLVEDFDYVCNCGNRGCVEQICARAGILYQAKKRLKNENIPSTLRDIAEDELDVKDIFDKAKEGDIIANEVVDTVARYLARTFEIVSNIVDPEVFILGGGISKAGDFLVDKVKKYYEEYSVLSNNPAKILLATLGNNAGMYGAYEMIKLSR